jgi:hypothetical protein
MDMNEESAVQDFLEILEEHRRNCERQGKYVEAEIAKNRLDELKLHEENRRKEAMRSRQIAERLGVEEAHMLEFQQVTAILQATCQQTLLLTPESCRNGRSIQDASVIIMVLQLP